MLPYSIVQPTGRFGHALTQQVVLILVARTTFIADALCCRLILPPQLPRFRSWLWFARYNAVRWRL